MKKSPLVLLACFWLGCPADTGPSATTAATPDVLEDASAPVADTAGPDSTAGPDVPLPECQLSAQCAGVVLPSGPCEVPICLAGQGKCALQNVADGLACDDGNPCTAGDLCQAGACEPHGVLPCDDNNACTDSACNPAVGCQHLPNADTCDDGDSCTEADACHNGACGGAPVSCDDGNPCTNNPCDNALGCQFEPNDAPCNDLSACTTQDTCGGGLCAGTAITCDDGNDCTADSCAPQSGCVFADTIDACDDDNACTDADACAGGSCSGAAIKCADGEPCTDDSCHKLSGCVFTDNDAPCNDDSACTVSDTCAGGVCADASELACNDQNACTTDSCDPSVGCVFTDNALLCDDGQTCTANSVCANGACSGGESVCECTDNADCGAFEDGNACNGTLFCELASNTCKVAPNTIVTCAPSTDPCLVAVCEAADGLCALVPSPGALPCDDSDACTTVDTCAAGLCVGGLAADCADNNPCNGQACDPMEGCSNPPLVGDACDDGDPCTLNDACDSGVCLPGKNKACDDANVCTVDSCAAGACVNDPTAGNCDDGNPCTKDDVCLAGTCHSGTLVICNDNSPCTADLCDSDSGCITINVNAPCADGDPCFLPGFCSSGVCISGPPIYCDDDSPCTADWCDGGCKHDAQEASCNDANACTQDDVCAQGQCVGTPIGCADDDECTNDLCTPELGCVNQPNGQCGTCAGLECLACSNGTGCASSGELIDGTCCAQGDSLVYLAQSSGYELVDVETDGTHTFSCGGFGMHISRVANPADPVWLGTWLQRCQRIGVGPKNEDGHRVVFFAHHGDSWVSTPTLSTFAVTPDDGVFQLNEIQDQSTLFEGLVYYKSRLWVAAHGGGLRRYELDPKGVPQYLGNTSGFANAWKIAAQGHTLYVADGEGGLKVVDISNVDVPEIIQSVQTTALARDVTANAQRVFVGMGGGGVDVFDIQGQELAFVTNIDAAGSVQGVSVGSGRLAVAAWSHLAVYDATNLQLLGTELIKLFPEFNQVFGVAVHGNVMHVAEWEGLHLIQHVPGQVGPDLHIDTELINFGIGKTPAKGVLVRNRGLLPLDIYNISATPSSQFDATPKSLSVVPGGVEFFEVHFDASGLGPDFNLNGTLTLDTNDPDSGQSPFKMHITASTGQFGGLTVGDALNSKFSFLDPTGGNQLANLKGKVVILAYFALF